MPDSRSDGLVHQALLYASADDYCTGCSEFVEAGLAEGEPVLVAVPRHQQGVLRAALNGEARGVEFIDMTDLGRNPSRIIPAVRDWSEGHGGRRCRFIGEPIWPGRSRPETVEATRHEALLNFAFRESPISILCPYDTSRLDALVIADSERTHPELVCGGDHAASGGYEDPLDMWYAAEWPLPEPPARVATVSVGENLAALRRVVESYSRMVGLGIPRSSDLVLAVNEVATNALRYTDSPGELRIWLEGDRVVCEIRDGGRFEDPLAGRRRPDPDCVSGRGLWLVNQVCDLVELRPGDEGTTVRLHVDIAG